MANRNQTKTQEITLCIPQYGTKSLIYEETLRYRTEWVTCLQKRGGTGNPSPIFTDLKKTTDSLKPQFATQLVQSK